MNRYLLSTILTGSILLASCSVDHTESKATVSYQICNLITPIDGGESVATRGVYTFDFNLTDSKVAANTSTLLYDNNTYIFITDEVSFSQYPPFNGMVYYFTGMKANVYGFSSSDPQGGSLEDTKFLITSNFVFANPGYTPAEHPGLIYNRTQIPPLVIASYKVGSKFKVRTFASDAFYVGVTNTEYPNMTGGTDTNENKDMYYRVLIDVAGKKADVIFYDAKFSSSDREPKKVAIVINNLDIKYGDGFYEINGENIVPKLFEAGQLEDYPSFTFQNFSFKTTGDAMNGCVMNYTVNNTMAPGMSVTYKGTFSGMTFQIPDGISL